MIILESVLVERICVFQRAELLLVYYFGGSRGDTHSILASEFLELLPKYFSLSLCCV